MIWLAHVQVGAEAESGSVYRRRHKQVKRQCERQIKHAKLADLAQQPPEFVEVNGFAHVVIKARSRRHIMCFWGVIARNRNQ